MLNLTEKGSESQSQAIRKSKNTPTKTAQTTMNNAFGICEHWGHTMNRHYKQLIG
jgi:hypothetical protein